MGFLAADEAEVLLAQACDVVAPVAELDGCAASWAELIVLATDEPVEGRVGLSLLAVMFVDVWLDVLCAEQAEKGCALVAGLGGVWVGAGWLESADKYVAVDGVS